MVHIGNFRFLLLEFILADQLRDLPPLWERHLVAKNGNVSAISTIRVHIGRSTGQIYPPWTHLVARNGDFRFLLLVHIGRSAILDLYC